MYCAKCGKLVTENDVFCPNCGNEVNSTGVCAVAGASAVEDTRKGGFHISERTARIGAAVCTLLIAVGLFLPFFVISFFGMREPYSVFAIMKEAYTESEEKVVVSVAVGVIAFLVIGELLMALFRCRMKGMSILAGAAFLVADFGFYIHLERSLFDGEVSEIAHPGLGFYLILICSVMLVVFGFKARRKEE